MNISRGKIKKLRRSKSQSRRKLPKNKKKKHPPVIVIYGSGWSSNNKKFSDYQKKFFVKPLSEKGFATIAINHRSSMAHNIVRLQSMETESFSPSIVSEPD